MPNNTALTDDRRQALGEALSDYFGKLDSDEGIRSPDGRILRAFDYCDSRTIDDLIDRAIVPALAASPVEQPAAAPIHPDDACVDQFSASLKSKLALSRAKGRGGWESCDPADLSRMLRDHVEKGDPRDVANFCMFLWALGKPISAAALPMKKQPATALADEWAARLDDADIDTIAESMPGGLDSFMKQWGWRQFARAVEDEVILNVARVSSAHETGAEGARLKQRVIIGATVFEKGVETKYVLEALAR
ncbi:hypothetical protein QZM22_01870 [Burkholderia oklahomensis]|uniref:hypothetical protein n=1 Tax=Burkholderia oklahomensis TaxID=342113 RepID=UPI00264CE6FB|nr:hypothetical protein [Burkholderia oklahomensis]MDN7671297.1 hypothetical protein [Burkholderia oklahomensis]